MNLLRLLIFTASATPILLTHSPATAQQDRIEARWPAQHSAGAFEALAIGMFHTDHPGASVVVARGGVLYLSFLPTMFTNVAPVWAGPAQAIASVGHANKASSPQGRADALAVTDASGLRLLGFSATTRAFEATSPTLPAWSNVTKLVTRADTIPNSDSILIAGIDDVANTVELAYSDSDSDLRSEATIALPGIPVDIAFTDFNGNGATELVVAMPMGLAILDLQGQELVTFPAAPGVDSAMLAVPQPGLVALTLGSGTVFTLVAIDKLGVSIQGTFAPANGTLVGVDVVDIESDGVMDLAFTSTLGSTIYLSNQAGTFDPLAPISVPHSITEPPGGLVAAAYYDIDADQRDECIVLDDASQRLIVHQDYQALAVNLPTLPEVKALINSGPTTSHSDLVLEDLVDSQAFVVVWQEQSADEFAPISGTLAMPVQGELTVPIPNHFDSLQPTLWADGAPRYMLEIWRVDSELGAIEPVLIGFAVPTTTQPQASALVQAWVGDNGEPPAPFPVGTRILGSRVRRPIPQATESDAPAPPPPSQ